VTLDRSFKNRAYNGVGRLSPTHLDQRSNSTRRHCGSQFKGNAIYDRPQSRSVLSIRSPMPAFENASRLRDMRAVCELRSLTYCLNGVRLTENADGEFHRLRKVSIDAVTKYG
jgi:hypothetical protein